MADPPGEPSSSPTRHDYYDDALEHDRPLICSNPSSYASCSNSSGTGTTATETSRDNYARSGSGGGCSNRSRSRGRSSDSTQLHINITRTTTQQQQMITEDDDDDGPSFMLGQNNDDDNPRRRYQRRQSAKSTFTTGAKSTFTAHAAYFEEHYADPVESVAGSMLQYPCSPVPPHSMGRQSSSLASSISSRKLPSNDSSFGGSGGKQQQRGAAAGGAENHGGLQLVDGYWSAVDVPLPTPDETRPMHHDHNNELVKYGTPGGSEDDLSDFDCEEHYRRLPPPRVPPPPQDNRMPRSPVPREREEGFREECKIVVRRGLEPEEVLRPEEYPIKGAEKTKTRDLVVRRERSREPRRDASSREIVPTNFHNQPPRPSSREIVPTAKFQNQLAIVEPPPSPAIDISQRYNGYQHCFITIREEHRFLMLYTFLKNHAGDKIIIFFSTTKSVRYYAKLLGRLKFNVRAIHDGQSKEKFLDTFFQFSRDGERSNGENREGEGSILCMPDFQGNDVAIPPTTSWLVQFEPCSDPSEYIFRVGRISSEMRCHPGRDGAASFAPPRALLFLTPDQFGFLKYFKAAKVKFYEYEIPKIASVQNQLVRLIRKDDKLRRMGVEAYRAYLMAYTGHEYRDIYNVHELDRKKVALCFGFDRPPSKEDGDDDNDDDEDNEEKEKRSRREKPAAPSSRTREERRWKPVKNERSGWMTGEKSWKYGHVHADKMKARGGKTNPDDYKPKSVTLR